MFDMVDGLVTHTVAIDALGVSLSMATRSLTALGVVKSTTCVH
jgi:hypothetical protein